MSYHTLKDADFSFGEILFEKYFWISNSLKNKMNKIDNKISIPGLYFY